MALSHCLMHKWADNRARVLGTSSWPLWNGAITCTYYGHLWTLDCTPFCFLDSLIFDSKSKTVSSQSSCRDSKHNSGWVVALWRRCVCWNAMDVLLGISCDWANIAVIFRRFLWCTKEVLDHPGCHDMSRQSSLSEWDKRVTLEKAKGFGLKSDTSTTSPKPPGHHLVDHALPCFHPSSHRCLSFGPRRDNDHRLSQSKSLRLWISVHKNTWFIFIQKVYHSLFMSMSVQPKSLKGKTWLQAASCPCNSFSKPLNALHKHHQVLPHGKALATDQPQKNLWQGTLFLATPFSWLMPGICLSC